MNKKNFVIDIIIFLAFLVAMEPNFSGVAVHEWLSLALAATIVVHLLLHWDWIITIGSQFFKKLWHTSRLKFVVDILLFISVVAIMISGIMISRVILPTLGVEIQSGMAWRVIHSTSADLSILLLGVHFALNWSWVWDKCKRYIFSPIGRLFKHKTTQPAIAVINDEPGS